MLLFLLHYWLAWLHVCVLWQERERGKKKVVLQQYNYKRVFALYGTVCAAFSKTSCSRSVMTFLAPLCSLVARTALRLPRRTSSVVP